MMDVDLGGLLMSDNAFDIDLDPSPDWLLHIDEAWL